MKMQMRSLKSHVFGGRTLKRDDTFEADTPQQATLLAALGRAVVEPVRPARIDAMRYESKVTEADVPTPATKRRGRPPGSGKYSTRVLTAE